MHECTSIHTFLADEFWDFFCFTSDRLEAEFEYELFPHPDPRVESKNAMHVHGLSKAMAYREPRTH